MDYLVVSNGLDSYCCKMDYVGKKYLFLEAIPDYRDIWKAASAFIIFLSQQLPYIPCGLSDSTVSRRATLYWLFFWTPLSHPFHDRFKLSSSFWVEKMTIIL